MNVADLVKETGRKKELDFFKKVEYICDNFGRDINRNESDEIKAYYYGLPESPDQWNYLMHILPQNLVLIHNENSSVCYDLVKRDYTSQFSHPIIPERWEKMIEDLLKKYE